MKKIICIILIILITSINSYAQLFNGDNLPEGAIAASGSLSVVQNPENVADNALKFTSSGESILHIPIDSIDGGIIELSYKLRFSAIGNAIIYMPTLASVEGDIITPMYHKGGLAINNGGTMNFFRTYYENTWYTIKIIYDTGAQKYDVYVDNVLKCKDYTFSNAVVNPVDKITVNISSGYILIDDISVLKIGESSNRFILFNSKYSVSHYDYIIGRLPYRMTKADFFGTLQFKTGVSASLSTAGKYIKTNDVLTVTDDIYNKTYTYTIQVRSPNVSINFYKRFKNWIVLKDNNEYCYINGEEKVITDAFKDGKISETVLDLYGINVTNPHTVAQLEYIGVYTRQIDDYLVVSKTPFVYPEIMMLSWKHELAKLY